MSIKTIDSNPQAPLSEQKPYQTPKLEIHERYSALTFGIGLSFGELVPSPPSILDDSQILNPEELSI